MTRPRWKALFIPESTRSYLPHRLFLKLAGLFALLWLIGELAGWRAHTAVLSGTVPLAEGDWFLAASLGLFYAIAYFAAVAAGPILVIAAALSYLGEKLLVRPLPSKRGERTQDNPQHGQGISTRTGGAGTGPPVGVRPAS